MFSEKCTNNTNLLTQYSYFKPNIFFTSTYRAYHDELVQPREFYIIRYQRTFILISIHSAIKEELW